MPKTTSARELPIWDNLIGDLVDNHLTPEMVKRVEAFALTLDAMTDGDLAAECESYIYGSAFWNGRGRIDHPDHAMCDLCLNESKRRSPDGEPVVYRRAHAAVMRSQGYA